MTSRFVTVDQKKHLEAAKRLTGSEGFLEDAYAIAIYRDGREGDAQALAAVAVFEAFRGGRAELHFGAEDGQPLSADWIIAMVTIAFHPKTFNLRNLIARVPDWNVAAQIMLLKLGFEFEYRDRASTAGGDDGIVFSIERDKIADQAAAGPKLDTHTHTDVASVE